MLNTIRHRGPDGEGTYLSGQIGLGHRRLSIIDLSTGQQPLANEDGTVWIVFNGEIYNYQDLRPELMAHGHRFRTRSDTEVIVHLYEEYGEACVERLRGMFAFAIWDDRRKVLFLARDRVGIKPLYYLRSDRFLIFASEIKSILADPEVRAEVVPQMIDRFLTYYYTPGEDTIFRNIHKLAPASYMTVRDGQISLRQYWDLHFVPSNLSLRDAQERLMEVLEESVRLHMIADVPVGFLLSGGVDSTAMLGLAVGKTDRPLSSYTIGFSELGPNDERPYAKLAALAYGSVHHEMTISAKDFVDFFPKYVWHMEEPVCEPPAVALYYVSRLAKDFVKVLISGEGGDEAFAGYPNYRNNLWFERLKEAFKPFPGFLSMLTAMACVLLRSKRIAKYRQLVDVPLESYYYSRTSGPHSFFNQHVGELYSKDFAHQVGKADSLNVVRKYFRNGAPDDMVNRMLYVDTKTWLPDDLLVKADKMTMANSIELRVPLLDHVLLQFAASLPGSYKVRGFTTKYIAKRALSRRVSPEIIARKKTGFPVPYESWLKKDLSEWIKGILLDRQTISRGYFQQACIDWMIRENQRTGAYSKEIFSLATLELWHRVFLGDASAPSTLLPAPKAD
jgi:asparagine synthase (glutamine-hydrolysing)